MNIQQIVALALRITSMVIVIYSAKLLSILIPTIIRFSDMPLSLRIGIPFLILAAPIVAAILLWKFPLTVARGLIPRESGTKQVVKISHREALTMAFIILGMYLLATSIPDIFYHYSFGYLETELRNGSFSQKTNAKIISTYVQIIIGLWLVFGTRGFINFVGRVRNVD